MSEMKNYRQKVQKGMNIVLSKLNSKNLQERRTARAIANLFSGLQKIEGLYREFEPERKISVGGKLEIEGSIASKRRFFEKKIEGILFTIGRDSGKKRNLVLSKQLLGIIKTANNETRDEHSRLFELKLKNLIKRTGKKTFRRKKPR